MSTKNKLLDIYLSEVYNQFVAIKDDDFKKSQEVFKSVFDQVKQKMGEQCNFFNKYGSQVMYGGSVYDGMKISKMDEFDMDIVIRLPISYENGENGIIMENDQPGYVRMKIINAFDNLDKQQEWERCHKVTREWRDSSKYFLQSKFRRWMHGIVQKALNTMEGKATVNGVNYLLDYKESGPAYTLNVRNVTGDVEFKLDVDIVPVIRFMLPRWPTGYRTVPDCKSREWLVVPKPIKGISDETVKGRCWRLSFQDYERELLKNSYNLKFALRLIKKMRNALNMKCIASYYIKTLFLWKVEQVGVKNKDFWQTSPTVLFRIMLEELHGAITNKRISYFWNQKNNLIDSMKPGVQSVYAENLKSVLDSIRTNNVNKILQAILTHEELKHFKCTEFYQKRLPLTNIQSPSHNFQRESSTESSQDYEPPKAT